MDVAVSVGRDRNPAPRAEARHPKLHVPLRIPLWSQIFLSFNLSRFSKVMQPHTLLPRAYLLQLSLCSPKDSPRPPNAILCLTYYLTPKYVTCPTAPHFSDVLSYMPRPLFRVPQDHTHVAPASPPTVPSLSVDGTLHSSPSLSQPLTLVPGASLGPQLGSARSNLLSTGAASQPARAGVAGLRVATRGQESLATAGGLPLPGGGLGRTDPGVRRFRSLSGNFFPLSLLGRKARKELSLLDSPARAGLRLSGWNCRAGQGAVSKVGLFREVVGEGVQNQPLVHSLPTSPFLLSPQSGAPGSSGVGD